MSDKRYLVLIVGLALVLVGLLSWLSPRQPLALTNVRTTTSSYNQNPMVTIKTNKGEITLELFADQAPNTVQNFVSLAQKGFYNGTQFHRVIRGFMIQGGDPNTKEQPDNWAIHGTGGPGYVFDDEQNDIPLERGVIAMANAGIRGGRGTNGSQFFIITAPKVDWLNQPGGGWHTPFGKVTQGMEIVSAIEQVAVNENDHPTTPVIVEEVIVQ